MPTKPNNQLLITDSDDDTLDVTFYPKEDPSHDDGQDFLVAVKNANDCSVMALDIPAARALVQFLQGKLGLTPSACKIEYR